jgi:acetylornithine aminotransferase/putrescine aminotransferase
MTNYSPAPTSFLQRYGNLFGREQALLLKMAGMDAAEQSAEGPWVTDSNGRRWLDFGSFGLHLIGHRHPHVIEAWTRQASRIGLSTKILPNEVIAEAAESLRLITERPNDMVLFANTGSEAVESALKLARLSTGRSRIIALKHAYHGRTAGALALSYGYRHAAALTDVGRVSFVDSGDLPGVEQLLAAGDVAAVIAEPVQGEGGIRLVDTEFLHGAYELCRRHGSLMIHDEVQTGLGRAGGLVCGAPSDIAVFGKTLGGGVFPVAAVVHDRIRIGSAARDPVVHASSYSGSALAGAVAGAVLEVVGAPGFCERVQVLGHRALKLLQSRLLALPGVREVRGRGLMLGVEFERHEQVGQTLIEAARLGVLTAFCLTDTHVLRVYPPAILSEELLDQGLQLFCDACEIAYQALLPSTEATI